MKRSASDSSLQFVNEVTSFRRSRHFQEFQTIVPLSKEAEAPPTRVDAFLDYTTQTAQPLPPNTINVNETSSSTAAVSFNKFSRPFPFIASNVTPIPILYDSIPESIYKKSESICLNKDIESDVLSKQPSPLPTIYPSASTSLPLKSQLVNRETFKPVVHEEPETFEVRSYSEHSPLTPSAYSVQLSTESFESLSFYRTAGWRHPRVYSQKDDSVKQSSNGSPDRVLIIVTGGTICMVNKGIDKSLKPAKFVEFMHSLPEMNEEYFPSYDILEWEELLDSSDVGVEQWKAISSQIQKKYDDYCGFVILHGTDTMAYTASALSFILENLTKPVVLTGSMLPIRDTSTDARRNLAVALLVAKIPYIMEVVMVFGSRIMRGNRVSKCDCSQLEAFDSPNYPYLGRVGVHLTLNDALLLHPPTNPFRIETALCSNIMVFSMTPCFSLNLFSKAMHASLPMGVILRVYGCGTLPNNRELLHLLECGVKRGVTIAILTQCPKGEVKFLAYENGVALSKLGVINGKDMTVEACMAKMAYLMGKGFTGPDLKTLMENEICGEISVE